VVEDIDLSHLILTAIRAPTGWEIFSPRGLTEHGSFQHHAKAKPRKPADIRPGIVVALKRPRKEPRMKPRFVELAADPSLVHGIYNYCDQWCTYCPHTERCLAFKCLRDQEQRRPGDIFEDLAASVNEMISFSRDVVQSEGAASPLAELAVLPTIGSSVDLPHIDDPLERRGREYAMETARFLMSVAPTLPMPKGGAGGTPAPMEVVLWYHALIAVKIYRALASAAMSRQGKPGLVDDAQGSAKVALIAIDRSRKALRQLKSKLHDARIDRLLGRLERLGAEMERRFPDARAFVRPGLDEAMT
jgi:hypothetical protein